MNASCMICTDLFTASSEVFVTTCGHMFHYTCLIQWIERSKTCPQCRCKVTEKTMHRVFFNTQNTDNITDDLGSLQNKVDNLNFQLRLKEKDIKIYTEKYKTVKNQNIGLREEIKKLEDKTRVSDSAIHAQKQQTLFYKQKYQDMQRMGDEVQKLKDQLKNLNNLQLVLHGSREQVAQMLLQNNDSEALCLLVNTLKKELVDITNKRKQMKQTILQLQNECSIYKKERDMLKAENSRLSGEHQVKWEFERKIMKNKIIELEEKCRVASLNSSKTYSPNNTIRRIITESPAPLRSTPDDDANSIVVSPTVKEHVQAIEESNSPYLQVKSTSVGLKGLLKVRYSSISPGLSVETSNSQSTKPNSGQLSILMQIRDQNKMNAKIKNLEVSSNGLGGHSKTDTFPTPVRSSLNLKRPKQNTYVPSKKFKKLGQNKKLDDYAITSTNSI